MPAAAARVSASVPLACAARSRGFGLAECGRLGASARGLRRLATQGGRVAPAPLAAGRARAAASSAAATSVSAAEEAARERERGLGVVRDVRPRTGDAAAEWIKQSLQEYYSSRGHGVSYRSNAAWSLRQIDDRFSILRKGNVVVDLGCFSGGWSQVAVERTGAAVESTGGMVIGVDKVRMEPLPNHTFVHGDVAEPETLSAVLGHLGPRRADVVLADVAPPLVNLKEEDHLGSAESCLHASNIMEKTLALGGWFVVKMLYGSQSAHFRLYLNTRFEAVRTIRPRASRAEFREMFFICRGFMGRAPIAEEVSTQGNFGTKHEGVDRWGKRTREPTDDSGPAGGISG
eukprot:TRINITY_DN2648_c1_g2_i1.p1 TRINITY_DN2648_c1_g2~~TRINITY_DN2648_c1_g2_i1.p1  ORF type:complete len:346 (-),score=73.35 TRINITY_DN2648_c1_g2_i1:5-1042(-)